MPDNNHPSNNEMAGLRSLTELHAAYEGILLLYYTVHFSQSMSLIVFRRV